MWCLRTIADQHSLPGLKRLAYTVSKESTKYDATYTDEIYSSNAPPNLPKLGLGSLIRWAKEKNPEEFMVWKNSIRQKRAVRKFSGSSKPDHDIELLLSLFCDDDVAEHFVKTQGQDSRVGADGEIYHWEKHFWIQTDESVICSILGEDIYRRMKIKLDLHYDKEQDSKEYILFFKKINALRNCKPRMGYIKAIMQKLRRKQFKHSLALSFDENHDLLCFTNGVYELNTGT
jgi:hypothetical protein